MFENIRLKKILQGNSNRNRAALKVMRELGFSMPNIRLAILKLNDLAQKDIAAGQVSLATLSNTVKGVRNNEVAQGLVADNLGLTVSELFAE